MSLSRRFRRSVKKNRLTAKKKRKVHLEPLEPRILLSADLSYTMAGASEELTIKYDQGTGELQLLDDASSILSSASMDTEAAATVSVTGTGGDDVLSIDFTDLDLLSFDSLDISFDGGDGADVLNIIGEEDLGTANLIVNAESITLDSTTDITTTGDIDFTADSSLDLSSVLLFGLDT